MSEQKSRLEEIVTEMPDEHFAKAAEIVENEKERRGQGDVPEVPLGDVAFDQWKRDIIKKAERERASKR